MLETLNVNLITVHGLWLGLSLWILILTLSHLTPVSIWSHFLSNSLKKGWMGKEMHLDNYYKRLWTTNKIKAFKKWEALWGLTVARLWYVDVCSHITVCWDECVCETAWEMLLLCKGNISLSKLKHEKCVNAEGRPALRCQHRMFILCETIIKDIVLHTEKKLCVRITCATSMF